MPFENNHKLSEGRPRGSKNITTQNVRNNFQALVQNNLEQLQKDIDTLEPYERIKIIMQLSKFILPQLKSIEVEKVDPRDKFRHYTDEQLHNRILELVRKSGYTIEKDLSISAD